MNSFFGRFGASFNQSWTQQLDTTKKELAYGVATDSSGNVYVAGMIYGESEENSPLDQIQPLRIQAVDEAIRDF